MKSEEQIKKNKLILNIDEETWSRVKKHKIDYGLKNLNETVIKLVKRGLRRV